MTPEEERKARESRVKAAWAELALNPSFKTVLEEDLQLVFNSYRPRFKAGDEGNTHYAAIRDGEGNVLAYILKRVMRGVIALEQDDDSPARPTKARAEFKGNQQKDNA